MRQNIFYSAETIDHPQKITYNNYCGFLSFQCANLFKRAAFGRLCRLLFGFFQQRLSPALCRQLDAGQHQFGPDDALGATHFGAVTTRHRGRFVKRVRTKIAGLTISNLSLYLHRHRRNCNCFLFFIFRVTKTYSASAVDLDESSINHRGGTVRTILQITRPVVNASDYTGRQTRENQCLVIDAGILYYTVVEFEKICFPPERRRESEAFETLTGTTTAVARVLDWSSRSAGATRVEAGPVIIRCRGGSVYNCRRRFVRASHMLPSSVCFRHLFESRYPRPQPNYTSDPNKRESNNKVFQIIAFFDVYNRFSNDH